MDADLEQLQDDQPVVDQPPAARPLNRPVRWLVAAVEVVAAVALVALAIWAWRRASIPMRLPESDNPAIPSFTSRLSGPWVAAAVVAATVAGGLLLDALREAVLAARGRRRGAGTPGDDVPGVPGDDVPFGP